MDINEDYVMVEVMFYPWFTLIRKNSVYFLLKYDRNIDWNNIIIEYLSIYLFVYTSIDSIYTLYCSSTRGL